MSNLAGAAVALVILVDLATGQGPPVYSNYLQTSQSYQAPLPPMRPLAYMQRAEYEPKKLDKEYEKAIELGKNDMSAKELHRQHKHGHSKEADKEYEKSEKSDYSNQSDDYDKKYESSTPAPGVLSSFSNSMSGAWSRISGLGRSTRSVVDELQNTTSAASNSEIPDSKTGSNAASSSGRGMDSYDSLQQRANGFIYFKVPKHLVCNY